MDAQTLLKLLATGGDTIRPASWDEIVEVLFSSQRFWASIPVRALEQSTTDIATCVHEMATALFGDSPSRNELGYARSVLKRLRQYVVYGRTQYIIEAPVLAGLLRAQNGRCRTCGYRFTPDDFRAREFLDEPNADAQIGSLLPPQVDHIVPIFVGPHEPNNWQVLCRKCNLLKSSALLWPLKASLLAPFRPMELLLPSDTLAWMAMARSRKCERCLLGPLELRSDGAILHVERRDPSRGWLLINLIVICSDCRQTDATATEA